MDPTAFDAIVCARSARGNRRRLMRLAATLPAASLVAGLLVERSTPMDKAMARELVEVAAVDADARHHPGQDKNNGKSRDKKTCTKAGQTPRTGTRKGCCAGLSTDASGRCAAPVICTGLTPTATSPTQGLQEAIDAAQTGSVLTLCAGTWNLTETMIITKNLALIGAGADMTVLDGGDAVRELQIETGNTVTLQDLTIRRGKADYGGGSSTAARSP